MYALFLWTIITTAGSVPIYGWQYQTDFTSKERCVAAAKDLQARAPVKDEDKTFRCIQK